MIKSFIFEQPEPNAVWTIATDKPDGTNYYVMYVKDSIGYVRDIQTQLIEPAGIILDFGFEEVSGSAYVMYEVPDNIVSDCVNGCHNVTINNNITCPHS